MANKPTLGSFNWSNLDEQDLEPLMRMMAYLSGKRDGMYPAGKAHAVSRSVYSNVLDIETNKILDEATDVADTTKNIHTFPTGVRTIAVLFEGGDAPNIAVYPTEYEDVETTPHDAPGVGTLAEEVLREFTALEDITLHPAAEEADRVQRFVKLVPDEGKALYIDNFDTDIAAVAFSPDPAGTITKVTVQGFINNA